MRTTVDLPDDLFRRVKATAALRGTSLKDFITQAIEDELARQKAPDDYTVKLPLIRSKRPGALHLTNAQIEDLLA